jgi:phosphoribosylamine--glycine ligase
LNILVIGGGGREHCLVWKISKSPLVEEIFAVPGNAGISEIAECIDLDISENNFNSLLNLVEERGIDLTVVGPEAPLVDGIVDYFSLRGHKIFGPSKAAAAMEGSKVFAKELLQKYGIPSAEGVIFKKEDYDRAVEYINKRKTFPLVVKADGLAAGKGVLIVDNKAQAVEAVRDCFIRGKFGSSGDRVIIEEFLDGYEVSVLCLCDGHSIVPMDPAQDYKRIFDNDKGKNTGGMGSYSPVPMLDENTYQQILSRIIFPTGDAMAREGIDYKGILYAGILVSGGKPYLLEYNCRFGDPETQVVLPRLNQDLVPLLLQCVDGNITEKTLKWDEDKCICVVAASEGYPESSSKGDVVGGLEYFKGSDDIIIFHAGTKKVKGDVVTNGGRVLGMVSKASTFKEVRKRVYDAMVKIKFRGIQYRKDIAFKAERGC